jgi:hypothetical protein
MPVEGAPTRAFRHGARERAANAWREKTGRETRIVGTFSIK